MAWTYEQSLAASYQDSQIEAQRANADIDAAHLNEDWSSLQAAKNRLRDAEQDAAWIIQKANLLQRQQQQAVPANKFGLSRKEQEVAELSFVPRRDLPNLTTEQKHQMYAYNKAKYARMRQTGEYSDSQGRQREKF